jgi:hypothetical protein
MTWCALRADELITRKGKVDGCVGGRMTQNEEKRARADEVIE